MLRIAVDHQIEVRVLEEHHAGELYALIDRNREHIRQWLPWPDFTRSVDDSKEFIRRSMVRFGHQEELACGIWYRSRLTGGTGAHFDRANRTAAVGYWIDKELEGQGVVWRTTKAMVRYLFAHWAIQRVEIRCASGNHRSRKIPERLGFHNDGTLRSAFVLGDKTLDVVVYSMLLPEWESATAREPG